MFRKRTTKRYRRREEKEDLINLGVTSPRLVLLRSVSRLAWLIKILLLSAMLGLASWGVYEFVHSYLLDNKQYRLKDISLETNGTITKQRIVEESRIKDGATLFSLDLDLIKRELEKLPEVVEVSVKRRLPDMLEVKVVERIPSAWLEAEHVEIGKRETKSGMLIGEDGVLFPCSKKMLGRAKLLPSITVVTGERFAFKTAEKVQHDEALRALDLVKLHREINPGEDVTLKSIKIENFYTLVAEYSDDSLIKFSMHDHRRQLRDLQKIRTHAKKLNKEISWLDLRPKSSIPGQYKGSEAETVKPPQP